jgi:hypothetical protein
LCVSLRNTITSTVINTPRSTRVWKHHRLWEYSQFSYLFRRITFLLLTIMILSSFSYKLINFSDHAQCGKFFHMGCRLCYSFNTKHFLDTVLFFYTQLLCILYLCCMWFILGVSGCWIIRVELQLFWLCLWIFWCDFI